MDVPMTAESKQQLSQSQIQSLEILSMDTVTLHELIQNEYLENPMLEHQDVLPGWEEQLLEVDGSGTLSGPLISRHMARTDAAAVYAGGRQPDEDERSYEIPDRERDTVRKFIMSQLEGNRYTAQEQKLIQYMIDSLDQNGYFTATKEETALANHVSVETVAFCLEALQKLEPWGIFSSGLEECLLCQLRQQGMYDEVLEQMVRHHLKDIADGKISNITRALKISTAKARQYILLIRKLNPRPLAGFMPGEAQYVRPDVIFSGQDGRWEITLNDRWIDGYKISEQYLGLMEETQDPELLEYFRKKLERVKMLQKNIAQRRETILRIAGAVLEWQQDYFAGKGPLRPMTMAEIGAQIDLHTSTVSRGIRGKYIQSPGETIPFKNLFSQAVTTEEETSAGVTSAQVKKRIGEIIASEDASHPYSDRSIVNILEEEGILISRRTVAKYRDALHIGRSFQRRC